jgi:NitT/TauT family transport system permease protein
MNRKPLPGRHGRAWPAHVDGPSNWIQTRWPGGCQQKVERRHQAPVGRRCRIACLFASVGAVGAFARAPGLLMAQGWVTLVETLTGFGAAVLAGTAAGTLLATSRRMEQVLLPPLMVPHAIPKVSIAPLLIVWFGLGEGPRIVMVVLVCFCPIMISTTCGLLATPSELEQLARALAASRWTTFAKIRFPAALPYMFAGIRTALPLAPVGAVIGEVAGGSTGLGRVIVRSSASGDMPTAFAAITLLCGLSLSLVAAARGVERLLHRWVRVPTGTR